MKRKMMKIIMVTLILCSFFTMQSWARDPFIGEITIFAGSGDKPPRGWAFCEGQLLPISQNTALFSLLGTTYGGDGQTTFALPDLRGRVPVHPGQGTGLTDRSLGEEMGTKEVTLIEAQMPAHRHEITMDLEVEGTIKVSDAMGSSPEPQANHVLSRGNENERIYSDGVGAAVETATVNEAGTDALVTFTDAGESLPVSNMQPYITVRYIIALEGLFPIRP
ncbi:tail fiber protein [Anoxynatronum sibiricum]|uniref:Tail fiber protein n=2 Tax=Anoxynatronum sibiricum TaxID=210623 RepID=A0ABU9VZ37_9CLOT